jgi:hypothetical protein
VTEQIIWCAVCLQLNMIDQRPKQPAVTISHGVAMCTRHFAHTRTGMSRRVRKRILAAIQEKTI